MTIIIGAGLSGLLIGYRLKKEGIPFTILEARNRVGGRINTVYGTDNTSVEMGATWFTNDHINLIALLEELEIQYFEQYMKGTVFFQPTATSPVQSIEIPNQSPSYRISGGTSHLINTLYQKLDTNEVLLNQTVREIKFQKKSVQVIANTTFEVERVILAIPPKLWAKKISFEPPLPSNLMHIASQTHTWMEDAIKIALIYDQPFWEQQKMSGTLFSNSGPITEFYDHCNHQRSNYALCGFIHPSFKNISREERRGLVIKQIKKVYGVRAEEFIEYKECLWSNEENTFEASNAAIYPHQNNGNPIFSKSLFDDRMLISSSESALEFPGYMDGAVYSGNSIAQKITKG